MGVSEWRGCRLRVEGEKPFSEYDDFVKNVEKMGVKRAIEIYQDAYERYMKK